MADDGLSADCNTIETPTNRYSRSEGIWKIPTKEQKNKRRNVSITFLKEKKLSFATKRCKTYRLKFPVLKLQAETKPTKKNKRETLI
jgi:hypothetical protein